MSINRLGLALSGGGYRATLYHLGVIRFLRDANILPKITHITAVSGGSIIGAHLALNWQRYCGLNSEFDDAAQEIIDFVKLDVRNRIVRRFPLASLGNLGRRLLLLSPSRQLTRPGLLERQYERFLFGDVLLSDLPGQPQLHILATNISEGCLCAFNQNGLLLQRRMHGQRDHFENVQCGLATVSMAVAASSAFPGFFPPLEINGAEVGVDAGEFTRLAFTDGGVYDNLGLRMFRCIEQSWIQDAAPLRREDFLHLDDAISALISAGDLPDNTPLRLLSEMLEQSESNRQPGMPVSQSDDMINRTIQGLWDLIRFEELYRRPEFQTLKLNDVTAQALLNYVVASKREPDLGDRLWLNRQIVESVLGEAIGKPCMRLGRDQFDGVLVSDAGGKFKRSRDMRSGGLIQTAVRSSDILMDRVWQLEMEVFENTPGVLFFPISEVIDPSRDRTALDKEIQRQTARIRTDLDRFTDDEISALVRHGYCVARANCRSAEFIEDVPSDAPWDPLRRPSETSSTASNDDALGSHPAQVARRLQKSSKRIIWRRLLSFYDWPSYVWLALFIGITVGLSSYLYQSNRRSQQQQTVLDTIAEMSPNYRKILELLEDGPSPVFQAMPYDDVETLEDPDFTGFELISDTRIFDLRGLADATGRTPATSHSRLRLRRVAEGSENTNLRMRWFTENPDLHMVLDTPGLQPILTRSQRGEGYTFQLALDFTGIPIDRRVEVFRRRLLSTEIDDDPSKEWRFDVQVSAKTAFLQVWMLMPSDRTVKTFEVSSFPEGKPELATVVVPHSSVQIASHSITTFRIINPKPNYRYVCVWQWED